MNLQNPYVKIFLAGLAVGLLVVSAYAIGGYVVCENSGLVAVGGVLPERCASPQEIRGDSIIIEEAEGFVLWQS